MIRKYAALVRNNFTLRPSSVFFLFRHALTLWLLNLETKKQFEEIWGDFRRDRDLRPYRLMNPTSEGGAIIGDVVYLASTTDIGDGEILFAGDRNDVKSIWAQHFPVERMVTCGLHDMDIRWNFEEPIPPELVDRRFALIVSQAMIEHLIDPFGHLRDLASLLAPGGALVVHSVLPGFFYHRVPIDCFRFYPDWFETIADRFGLHVEEKQISVFHITYKLRRASA